MVLRWFMKKFSPTTYSPVKEEEGGHAMRGRDLFSSLYENKPQNDYGRLSMSNNDKPLPPLPVNCNRMYVVLYDYNAQTSSEVDVWEDEIVEVLNASPSWCLIKKNKGKVGYVPEKYIAEYSTVPEFEWYFPEVTRLKSEHLLMSPRNQTGSFLIRNAESRNDGYSLSVRCGDKVRHYIINTTISNGCCISYRKFKSLPELVRYFQGDQTGSIPQLTKPCIKVENLWSLWHFCNTHDGSGLHKGQITKMKNSIKVDGNFRKYRDGSADEKSLKIVSRPAPSWEGTAVIDGQFKELKLEDYRGKYLVFFFYPLDFTFVCPTEILAFNDRVKEFRALNTEVVACSVDSHFTHLAWTNTPRKDGGLGKLNIPLLSDITHKISIDYGVYLEDQGIALRGLFIIDDKGVLRQITMNDLPVGRSVDETLRLVQAFQFTDSHGEVCPAGWKPGDDTIIPNPQEKLKYFSKANQ